MGYYSHFELLNRDDLLMFEDFVQAKEKADDMVRDFLDGNLDDSYKWYSFENDIKEFSTQLPKLSFRCKRTGEESSDISFYIFQNGKKKQYQVPEPEFPDNKIWKTIDWEK